MVSNGWSRVIASIAKASHVTNCDDCNCLASAKGTSSTYRVQARISPEPWKSGCIQSEPAPATPDKHTDKSDLRGHCPTDTPYRKNRNTEKFGCMLKPPFPAMSVVFFFFLSQLRAEAGSFH